MTTLSLCMIVKNEQAVLARCLSSCGELFDEIVIVDTGSTDNTKLIAKRFGARIFDFVWCDDFSSARNFSFRQAKGEYIMWLDADDVIEPQQLQRLIELKSRLENLNADTIFIKYNTAFDSLHRPTYSFYRERILRNCEKAVFVEPVHEVIVPFGNIVYFDAAISHKKLSPQKIKKGEKNKTGRNLRIYQQLIKAKKPLSPRSQYYYARELMQHKRFTAAVRAFRQFIKTQNGWIEDIIQAHICLAECYEALMLPKKAVDALIESTKLARPTAKACCMIGQYFLKQDDLLCARFWFTAALECTPPKNYIGFCESDYYQFIPAIWLAVVYDRLGEKALAKKYNRLAGSFKPSHPSYLHNKQYLND